MRQLITRIDEDLHAKIRRRAADEGRSVNSFVSEILEREVAAIDRRASLRARARAAGKLVTPPRPKRVPSMKQVGQATRGVGRVASQALTRERSDR